MSEPQLGFWVGAVASIVTALGGAKGVVLLLRRHASFRSAKRQALEAEQKRVSAIRDDNEAFKTEMRSGMASVTTRLQRIDAELRTQVLADDRPIMKACEEGMVDFVNPAFTRDLGWTIEQMHGHGWITNAVSAVDQRKVREQWQSAVANGDFLQTDCVVRHKSGTLVGVASIECHPRKCIDESKFGWLLVLRLKKAA